MEQNKKETCALGSGRAFALLQKLNFVREAGSAEELRAARLLQEELASFGVQSTLEPFEIDDAEACSAELTVLAPYRAQVPVTAYKCGGCTPEGGLEAALVYVENALDANLTDVRGKIVLVNGFLRLPVYRRLVQAGAAAFLTFSGALLDRENESDLFTRMLRAPLRRFGVLPGANMRISQAFELVKNGAARVRLEVHNTPVRRTSHNVTAVLPGTRLPDEILSFGAHYDSVPFSAGVYDNGAGSVLLMELARRFAAEPPARTVALNWFGSEEIGLEGSRAYVSAHAAELARHRLMVNVDVAGPVLGQETCCVSAGEELAHFTDAFMKLGGWPVPVQRGISSSDSVPFADAGVPAVNFSRSGAPGGAYIHCRDDVLRWLSPEALARTLAPLAAFSDALVNGAVFPFERRVPDDIVKDLDEYLYKKELGEAGRADAEKAAGEAPKG